MNAPIVDHSQDSPNVSPSFNNREDTLFIEDPLDPSSAFSRSTEDELILFSSTPMLDSSDHEDAEEFFDFSNPGSRDPLGSNFDHDHESIATDLSKPPVYDDLLDDEAETPKAVEAILPKLMVMSCCCFLEVSLTSDHEILQSPKALHHSSVCIEDPSPTQITLPPLKLHDPITHAFKESYSTRTHSRCKLSLFLSFSCMS